MLAFIVMGTINPSPAEPVYTFANSVDPDQLVASEAN